MAKRVKVLGPANDAGCEADIVLAKMLQSAEARGLKPMQGNYTDAYFQPNREPTACCALGAWNFDEAGESALPYGIDGLEIVNGNDGDDGIGGMSYAIGAAFQEAMGAG